MLFHELSLWNSQTAMNGRPVFVDSTVWIALLHRRDELHGRAVEKYQQLVDDGRWLVTSSLILVEVANALVMHDSRLLVGSLEIWSC